MIRVSVSVGAVIVAGDGAVVVVCLVPLGA